MLLYVCSFMLLFVKQKTAYEMRISDWSSDVCSSDLRLLACGLLWRRLARLGLGFRLADEVGGFPLGGTAASLAAPRLADLFAVRLRLRFQRRFRRRAFLARVDADIAEQQVETERVDAGGEMFGKLGADKIGRAHV